MIVMTVSSSIRVNAENDDLWGVWRAFMGVLLLVEGNALLSSDNQNPPPRPRFWHDKARAEKTAAEEPKAVQAILSAASRSAVGSAVRSVRNAVAEFEPGLNEKSVWRRDWQAASGRAGGHDGRTQARVSRWSALVGSDSPRAGAPPAFRQVAGSLCRASFSRRLCL